MAVPFYAFPFPRRCLEEAGAGPAGAGREPPVAGRGGLPRVLGLAGRLHERLEIRVLPQGICFGLPFLQSFRGPRPEQYCRVAGAPRSGSGVQACHFRTPTARRLCWQILADHYKELCPDSSCRESPVSPGPGTAREQSCGTESGGNTLAQVPMETLQ